jgi:uncharacterized protein (DUF433 family)
MGFESPAEEAVWPTMDHAETVDWSACRLVEMKPDVQSGVPVLKGTRLPAAAIVDNSDFGVDASEIAEQFEVTLELVEAVLAYAKSHRVAHSI